MRHDNGHEIGKQFFLKIDLERGAPRRIQQAGGAQFVRSRYGMVIIPAVGQLRD